MHSRSGMIQGKQVLWCWTGMSISAAPSVFTDVLWNEHTASCLASDWLPCNSWLWWRWASMTRGFALRYWCSGLQFVDSQLSFHQLGFNLLKLNCHFISCASALQILRFSFMHDMGCSMSFAVHTPALGWATADACLCESASMSWARPGLLMFVAASIYSYSCYLYRQQKGMLFSAASWHWQNPGSHLLCHLPGVFIHPCVCSDRHSLRHRERHLVSESKHKVCCL